MTAKQLNIKSRTYYFYNDLINAINFESINLKLDKKTWKDIDIYYIGYVDKNKPKDWCVNSVNPLNLIINKVFCIVEEGENGVKYLKIEKKHCDSVINKWNQVFVSIKYHIKNYEKITGYNNKKDGVKCMICNHYYFKDNFNYQLHVCNKCHDFSMTVMNLSDFFILNIKNNDYRVYISNIDKKQAIIILKKSNLDDKGVL